MGYDFDEVLTRRNTNCVKWDTYKAKEIPEDALPMWVADMDFEVPEPIAQAINDRASHPVFGYTILTKEYIDAIIHWMNTRHSWVVDPSWLVITPNVVSAINIAIRAFTNAGDKVLIQEPVYNPFSRSILNNGREVAINELLCHDDRFKINFNDFEAKVSDPSVKLFILCNPHNPVGRVWTPHELSRMGELCLAHNVLIVSDEIHQDIIMKGYKHTPMGTISDEVANHLITCTSTGKVFNTPTLSMGNIIIPNEEIREKFHIEWQNLGVETVSPFALKTVEIGYTQCGDWADAMIDYVDNNRKYVEAFIANQLPMLHVVKGEGTYLLWINMKQLNLTQKELMDFITHKAKLWVNSGDLFGKSGEGYIRMNVAMPRSYIVEAMHRLTLAINELLNL